MVIKLLNKGGNFKIRDLTIFMGTILNILKTTPCWVWFILSYVLCIGINATKTRIVWLPKLFIMPIVLVGIKINHFINANLITEINYIFCLLIGYISGYKLASQISIKIYKDKLSILLPGSYQTLVLLMVFFTIKYVFGFLSSTNPVAIQDYLILEHIISFMVSGYFIGKSLCFLKKFKKSTNVFKI
jgi:hypothetical protein